MDYAPVSRRTRLGQAKMFKKYREERKKQKSGEQSSHATTAVSSSLSAGGATNLGFDNEGVVGNVKDFPGTSNVNAIVLDDSDADVEFIGEVEEGQSMEGKDAFVIDDDEDDANGVDVEGRQVGKSGHDCCDVGCVKVEDVDVGDESDCGLMLYGDKNRVMADESNEVCNRSDDWVCNNSEDDSEEVESEESNESSEEEDSSDADDEDYEMGKSEVSGLAEASKSGEEEEEKRDDEVEIRFILTKRKKADGRENLFDFSDTKKDEEEEKEEEEDEVIFKRKKVDENINLFDSNNIKKDDDDVWGDDRSKNDYGYREHNCIANRTRSHWSSGHGKLGTISCPLYVDDDDDDKNETDDYGWIARHKEGTNGSREGNCEGEEEEDDDDDDDDDEQSRDQEVQKCGVKPTKGKGLALRQHEFIKVLADSLVDKAEGPLEEASEQTDELLIEPTLPLKFRFGIQESIAPEKSKEEKELDELWAEMALALCAYDIPDNAKIENEANRSPDSTLDIDTLCRQGNHQFILDEEIGLLCKHCSFVKVEIKYLVAPFSANPLGKYERRDSSLMPHNCFHDLHYQDTDNDSHPACDPHGYAQGTVWDIIPGIGKSMHPHQREGFEFLWKNIGGDIFLDRLQDSANCNGGCGCIISHAPGTGKTRLAIAFLQTYMKLYPTCRPVIVAPCSMLLTWEAEFKKWNVDIPFHNFNRLAFSGRENKVAISFMKKIYPGQHDLNSVRMVKLYSWKKDTSILGVSYRLFEELVGEDGIRGKAWFTSEDKEVRQVLLELPSLLLLDEGHTPRNDQSLIWKALSKIQTQKRIILSGTPFQNNFVELYNTLSLANPKFAEMISSRHCGAHHKNRAHKRNEGRWNWATLTNPIGKVTDDRLKAQRLAEVREMIGRFVHVHRGDILQERLPGLRDSVVILEPAYFQKTLLDGILQMRNLANFNLEYWMALVSVHPSLLLKVSLKSEELLVDRDKLQSLELNPEAGVKTKFLLQLIRYSAARNERVLVFSQFREPLAFIIKQLECYFGWRQDEDILCMHGGLEIDGRQLLIKRFNDTKSEAKVLLASTKACSEGINLVGASRVVLLDVVWNPSVERQAISRAYRLGQEKVVYVYHLVTSGTNEEEKYCRQAEKERLSELVFYSSEGAKAGARGGQNSSDISEHSKDKILEEMVQREGLKDIFKKIIYQPKDSNLVTSFGFMDHT